SLAASFPRRSEGCSQTRSGPGQDCRPPARNTLPSQAALAFAALRYSVSKCSVKGRFLRQTRARRKTFFPGTSPRQQGGLALSSERKSDHLLDESICRSSSYVASKRRALWVSLPSA